MPRSPASRPPRWYGIPLRVLIMTFLGTLLSFAVCLMLSILGTVIVAALRGAHPDMRFAYRHIALPVSLAAGAIILLFFLVTEVRYYRQSKALSEIERVS
jgi:uncharacterized BrkB/YihY/UPF0761 family membrane protein